MAANIYKNVQRVGACVASIVLVVGLFSTVARAVGDPTYEYTAEIFDLGSDGDTFTNTVTTDLDGNTFIGGHFTGTVIFDGVGGTDSQTTDFAHQASFVTKRDADGGYLWTRVFDASAGTATVLALAADSNGDLYAVGHFLGTVIFDGPGGSDSVTGTGSGSPFLTKYEADGTYMWTQTFDESAGGATGKGVAIDSSDNVYFTGDFGGTIIFDGPGGSDSATTATNLTYVTRYNANGTYGWTSHFDTTSPGDTDTNGIATDLSGNIYVGGTVNGDFTFGGSDSVNTGNSAGFMAKFNSAGTYQSVKTMDVDNFATGGFANVNAIDTDAAGNTYTVGRFGGDVIFDGPGGSDTASSNSVACAFVTKYNANGTYGWTQYVDDSAGEARAYGVAADTNGNVYVSGGFTGDITFDGPGGSDTQSDQNNDTFENTYLTQYAAADGTYGWTRSFDVGDNIANGIAILEGVATDADNNVYIAGYWGGTVIFDGPGGSDDITNSAFGFNTFLTKFSVDSSGGGGGDTDGDGISDTIENAAPNSGDANNDGQQDAQQDYVTSFVSSITSNYATLQVGQNCLVVSTGTSAESNNAVQDSGFDYPHGLTTFTLTCNTASTTITLHHYGINTAGLALRKYNPNNHAYLAMPNATLGNVTIAGQTVAKAVYQITDGGAFDTDGQVNGTIVDPVGLAVGVVGVPNTGLGGKR